MPALLLWMLVPVLVATAVVVFACVPVVFPPGVESEALGSCFPTPALKVTLLEYLSLWLTPPGPLVGAT